jgi:uncharacterized phage-associated protein
MSGKKLQKLVYYCQAWSLAWTGEPLFNEPIEAWRDGPVVPILFARHKYSVEVDAIEDADPSAFSEAQLDTIDSVLGFYGDRSANDLIKSSHSEQPWIDARRGLMPWQSGNQVISHASMREFYRSLNL